MSCTSSLFESSSNANLSSQSYLIQKGDIFFVHNDLGDGWLWVTAHRTGEQGLVFKVKKTPENIDNRIYSLHIINKRSTINKGSTIINTRIYCATSKSRLTRTPCSRGSTATWARTRPWTCWWEQDQGVSSSDRVITVPETTVSSSISTTRSNGSGLKRRVLGMYQ